MKLVYKYVGIDWKINYIRTDIYVLDSFTKNYRSMSAKSDWFRYDSPFIISFGIVYKGFRNIK